MTEEGTLRRSETIRAQAEHHLKVISIDMKKRAFSNPLPSKASIPKMAKEAGLLCVGNYVGTQDDFDRIRDFWSRT